MPASGRPDAEPPARAVPAWRRALGARVGVLLGVVVCGLALVALSQLLAEFRFGEVVAHLEALPAAAVAGAVALSALSYLTLAGYDLSALHYVGARLPLRTVLYASFTGYAISNNLGFTLLSGGSVRYRVYSAAGLPGPAVARIVLFCSATFAVGVCVVGSAGLLLQPAAAAALLHLPALAVRAIALLLIAALAAALALPLLVRGGVRLGRWTVELPSPRLVVVQMLISSADILMTAGILYVLLPDHDVGFAAFIGIYSAALLAGFASHVPGGIGVFESIVLLGLSAWMPVSGVLGALVVYRVVYYLLPLGLATLLLAGAELAELRRRTAWALRLARQAALVGPARLARRWRGA